MTLEKKGDSSMFKKIYLGLIIAILFSASFSLAEDLTITTYYPSPYGSYNELSTNFFNLGPTSAATCDKAGKMYYDTEDDMPYVCSGDPLDWKPLGHKIVYVANDTVSDYNTPFGTLATADKLSLGLTEGTWMVIVSFEAKPWQLDVAPGDNTNFFQWGLYDGNSYIAGDISASCNASMMWEDAAQGSCSSKTGAYRYYKSFSENKIYTTDTSKTLTLKFRTDWKVYVRKASIMAIKLN
jgi:hypothetical protein